MDNYNYKDSEMEITEKEYYKLTNAYASMRKAQRKWEEKNKDRRKEYIKQWQREHKEHLSAYQKEYRQRNKEENNERQK